MRRSVENAEHVGLYPVGSVKSIRDSMNSLETSPKRGLRRTGNFIINRRGTREICGYYLPPARALLHCNVVPNQDGPESTPSKNTVYVDTTSPYDPFYGNSRRGLQ